MTTTGKYATQTTVAVESTKAEIERVLRRYGATSFASGWDTSKAVIQFDIKERRIQFTMAMPARGDFATYKDRYNNIKARAETATDKEWEQACRSLWRSLLLVIKANLEAVEAGIIAFEVAFLPYMMLPNGATVAEHVGPQVTAAYETGITTPHMLSLGSGRG